MRTGLLFLILALPIPPPLGAQTLTDVRRLARAGDTAGAIAAADALLKREQRNAEAQWVAGLLHLSQVVPGAKVSRDRREAETHLKYAIRFGPDSAKYWLALADLYRADDLMTIRSQVPGLLGRAVEALVAAPTDSLTAEVGYRVARHEWERYEHFSRRYAPFEVGRGLGVPGTFAEWKYWEEFLDRGIREVPVSNQELTNAEGALWQVLNARADDVRSTGLLVVLLGETHRWEEAVPIARRLVRAAPDSGRAWAVLGLALARTGRWREASVAFDSALARMTPADLAPYRDLGRIMRRAGQLQWDTTAQDVRVRLDSLYWRVAQPLVLTGQNEVQAEFYARLTYADHRWSDWWVGFRGYETDIGTVYVAYGPPDVWLMFDRSFIVWVYRRTHFRFQFALTPGYTRARFAGDAREGLRVAREESPARFDNIPLFRDLDTILVQASQFRDRGDTTAVVVFGAIPIARLTESSPIAGLELSSGAVVTDSAGRELQRDRRAETVQGTALDGVAHRSWRLRLPAGPYLLRAEAYLPTLDRGARGMETLTVRDYPTGAVALSDVLAAGRIQPRDSLARRWSDFFIEPNGGRFVPGDSVALLWEIYDLAADSNGLAHFDVQLRLTVDAIERRSFAAQIVGGVSDAMGLSAVGDDQVALDYDRRAAVGPNGTVVEFVTVELRDAPEGRYTIEVLVRDRLTGAMARRERVMLVNRSPPARHMEYTTFR
ncbi:MAG: tetratricopeptide repeat protein [Gemmatimonadota bacterium]|nr:tetratricopeptide repeat protein [Gemmatimonadota bacterium]